MFQVNQATKNTYHQTKTNMKTETLIELQRSITGARWIVDRAGVNVMDSTEPLYCLVQCHENTLAKLQANASAIALVPELIAEVIRLREVLRACADQLDAETLGGEALDSARAALANDK
jgi:hypothetical protein